MLNPRASLGAVILGAVCAGSRQADRAATTTNTGVRRDVIGVSLYRFARFRHAQGEARRIVERSGRTRRPRGNLEIGTNQPPQPSKIPNLEENCLIQRRYWRRGAAGKFFTCA